VIESGFVMFTLSNVEIREGVDNPSGVGLTSDAFPEAVSSKTGVSVRYVHAPVKKCLLFVEPAQCHYWSY
jgi:hypothetical protein